MGYLDDAFLMRVHIAYTEECFGKHIIFKTSFLDTSWQIFTNQKITISKVCSKFQTNASLSKKKPKDI